MITRHDPADLSGKLSPPMQVSIGGSGIDSMFH